MPVDDPWLPAAAGGGAVPVARPMILIKTFKWVAPGATAEGYTELSNVHCLSVSKKLGPEPPRALFRYAFPVPDPDAPQSLEQAISTNNTLPKTIQIGDRLLVQATPPGGAPEWIFDGYALTWGAQLAGGVEVCTVEAVGAPKRLWDTPLKGAIIRPSDAPDVLGNDVQTDRVSQFNPKGVPNASPAGTDSGEDPKTYPVFMDPRPGRRAWTLNMAAAYLLYTGNDETIVYNPDRTTLDEALVARVPTGSLPFDPNNPGSYDARPITVPDTPLKGRDVLSQTWDLIRDYGFGLYSELSTDESTNPKWDIRIFPAQSGTVKQLALQPKGAQLDPALSNVAALDASRELEDVANSWEVHGHLCRYEAAFVLANGTPSQAADGASITALNAFDKTSPTYDGANRDKYRLYTFDETGEGHYEPGSAAQVTTAGDLQPVLGPADANGDLPFATIRRKPLPEMLTTDAAGTAYKPLLLISRDFDKTKPPCVWDGTGTWQKVQGGYEILKDRLGIRINNENPNKWKIGKSISAGDPYPLGEVKGVEDQCQPGANNFTLMLCCVIEGDTRVKGKADRREGNPIAQTIVRTIDAGDRYFKDTIAGHSWYAQGVDPIVKRDDTSAAGAEAAAARWATESGRFEGTVTIPRFTAHYETGDRIDQIEGRNLSFQTNVTGETGEAPVYPVVVGVEWEFQSGQYTRIRLSDASSERGNYQRALGGQRGHRG